MGSQPVPGGLDPMSRLNTSSQLSQVRWPWEWPPKVPPPCTATQPPSVNICADLCQHDTSQTGLGPVHRTTGTVPDSEGWIDTAQPATRRFFRGFQALALASQPGADPTLMSCE